MIVRVTLARQRTILEKLVLQDGVKFILGSPTGNPATDAEVTEPNKVIVLGLDFIGNSADPKLQYYYTPLGYFFTSGLMYTQYRDIAAKGMKSYVSVKSDDMMGHVADGWGNATWAVAAPDVKHLETVFFDLSTSDYGPIATKIISLHPDVVDFSYNISNAAPYNALYDAGYQGTIIPSDPTIFDAVKTHCGKAFMEGWESGSQDPILWPNQDPAMQALIDAYTKEYGTWISDGSAFLPVWFTLKDAIDNTQSVDVDIVKAYLDNQPHPVRTMTGYTQLFARPDMGNLRTVSGEPAMYIGTVKDGEFTFRQPITAKDHYLASILSYGLVDVYKAYWEQYGYPTFPAGETSYVKFSDLGITGHD